MGVKEDVVLQWTRGSTSHQLDGWTCGYRSLCVLLSVLHKMEEGSFKTDPPTVMTCTPADIESMRTEKAPAVYALKSGWLGYLPDGLFWKPEWKMDPDWDTTVSPFPDVYPDEWCSPAHVKMLACPSMNNIRLYERASRRPQGGGRKDSNRLYLVIVKAEFADKLQPVRDEWIQDILYVLCRSSRHDDAMLSVDDFFNHGTPWLKDKKPRKASRDTQPDLMASMTPDERKVFYILNQSGCSNCCRCKRTASTQVSGHAKRKRQEVKEAELRARLPATLEMPAGPSTIIADQDTEDKGPAYAPQVVRVRDSTTSTFGLAAPGDEVFRTLVVGTEDILEYNRMWFKIDVNKGLTILNDFAQSLDGDFWKEVGSKASEGRHRVRASSLILSDVVCLCLTLSDTA